MNSPPNPTQEDVVHSWHVRADAYNALIGRWSIFTDMVERLLDFAPKEFSGHALDIAGGSGLLAEQLLVRFPKASVMLVEPAEGMRVLARRRLGNQIKIRDVVGDKLERLSVFADAAFCSASFHLMNEETTLSSIASVLKPGAVFAANCWGHSFDEAVDLNQKVEWTSFVDQALSEYDQAPMHWPEKLKTKIKSAEGLRKIGKVCGLQLLEANIMTVDVDTKFNIEFAAMDPCFLHQVSADIRISVLERALNLCHGTDTISVVDLKFQKV